MQILAGIILLGVLITFHELGHFLFAKWLGVRVLVFSVGFGPKLFGFKRGETEYRLSAIPLGGYVRMFGESLADDLTEEEKKISFMHQPIWRKSLIAFAGPLFNFILPVILFFFLLVGTEQVFAPRIGTIASAGVAERAGLKPDDLILKVSHKPVYTFSEVADLISLHPNEPLVLTVQRETLSGKPVELDITVTPEPKPSNNPLERDQKVGRIGIMPALLLPIVSVSPESPLAKAGLRDLDVIKKIDGHEITSKTAMLAALFGVRPGSAIEIERHGNDNSIETRSISLTAPLSFNVPRKPVIIERKLEGDLSPEVLEHIEKTKILALEEQALWQKNRGVASANGLVVELTDKSVAENIGIALKDRIVAIGGEKMVTALQLQQGLMNQQKSPHVLGLLREDGTPVVIVFSMPAMDQVDLDADILTIFGIKTPVVFEPGEIIERHVGVAEALKRASLQTMDIGVMTVKSLWLMAKREVPASQIGGPIMLFDVAQQAAKKGLSYYIFIMCLLSVNLGLLNLLPIPALDGGHLLLFGIEAVQRKPLTMKTRAIATQIGVIILLLIMAFAIFNDLSRLFR